MNRGEDHGRAVLTEAAVRFIRKNYIPGNKGGCGSESRFSLSGLGKRFGVSHRQIWRVVHMENWAHVEGGDKP